MIRDVCETTFSLDEAPHTLLRSTSDQTKAKTLRQRRLAGSGAPGDAHAPGVRDCVHTEQSGRVRARHARGRPRHGQTARDWARERTRRGSCRRPRRRTSTPGTPRSLPSTWKRRPHLFRCPPVWLEPRPSCIAPLCPTHSSFSSSSDEKKKESRATCDHGHGRRVTGPGRTPELPLVRRLQLWFRLCFWWLALRATVGAACSKRLQPG